MTKHNCGPTFSFSEVYPGPARYLCWRTPLKIEMGKKEIKRVKSFATHVIQFKDSNILVFSWFLIFNHFNHFVRPLSFLYFHAKHQPASVRLYKLENTFHISETSKAITFMVSGSKRGEIPKDHIYPSQVPFTPYILVMYHVQTSEPFYIFSSLSSVRVCL